MFEKNKENKTEVLSTEYKLFSSSLVRTFVLIKLFRIDVTYNYVVRFSSVVFIKKNKKKVLKNVLATCARARTHN